jgi:hypothetical protein
MLDGAQPAQLEVRRAELVELDVVVQVLEEASAWLRSRGIDQWPATLSTDWIGPPVERGETWLASVAGEVAGTLTLAAHDPAWPDDERDVTFVHRLAVRRTHPGLGLRLLDWASGGARAQGHRALRLDCVATNSRLRRYYEDAGFLVRGEAIVHGAAVTLLERPT